MHHSYSLSSHECMPVGRTEEMCPATDWCVNVASQSNGGRLLHSFGMHAAKLLGSKLNIRQTSTCMSNRVQVYRLVLTVSK